MPHRLDAVCRRCYHAAVVVDPAPEFERFAGIRARLVCSECRSREVDTVLVYTGLVGGGTEDLSRATGRAG